MPVAVDTKDLAFQEITENTCRKRHLEADRMCVSIDTNGIGDNGYPQEKPMNKNLCCQNATISQAVYSDLEDILALQRIAYESEAALIGDYTIPPLTQTIREIKDEFRVARFLKAEIDTRIVGSVRAEVQDGTCYIKRLIVHPNIQNRGIGSSLLTAIEQDYPRVERYELFTGKKSESNHIFYTRRGYSPFKEEHVNERLTFLYYEKMNLPG